MRNATSSPASAMTRRSGAKTLHVFWIRQKIGWPFHTAAEIANQIERPRRSSGPPAAPDSILQRLAQDLRLAETLFPSHGRKFRIERFRQLAGNGLHGGIIIVVNRGNTECGAASLRHMDGRKLTQKQLAEMADMKESFITRIVHADSNCTFDVAGRILQALGVKAKLVEDAPVPPRSRQRRPGHSRK